MKQRWVSVRDSDVPERADVRGPVGTRTDTATQPVDRPASLHQLGA
jgi:hypothetical protein